MGIYQRKKGSQGICGTHISQRNGQSVLIRVEERRKKNSDVQQRNNKICHNDIDHLAKPVMSCSPL